MALTRMPKLKEANKSEFELIRRRSADLAEVWTESVTFGKLDTAAARVSHKLHRTNSNKFKDDYILYNHSVTSSRAVTISNQAR